MKMPETLLIKDIESGNGKYKQIAREKGKGLSVDRDGKVFHII